jgi:hypothetical protein
MVLRKLNGIQVAALVALSVVLASVLALVASVPARASGTLGHGPNGTCPNGRCHVIWNIEYTDDPVEMVWLSFSQIMDPCVVTPTSGVENMSAVAVWMSESPGGNGDYIEVGVDKSRFDTAAPTRNLYTASQGTNYEGYGIPNASHEYLVDYDDLHDRWRLWAFTGSGFHHLRDYPNNHLTSWIRGIQIGSETWPMQNDNGVQSVRGLAIKYVGNSNWYTLPGPDSAYTKVSSVPPSYTWTRYFLRVFEEPGQWTRVQVFSDHHLGSSPTYDNCGGQTK